MKTICTLLVALLTVFSTVPNKTVERVDLNRFSGTWYCLYSIPTVFDEGSREMTTRYTLNEDGYYDVFSSCKKGDSPELHTFKSKLFPVPGANNGQMKAQFIWPIKIDYWVIDLAGDYSYSVIGHPDHRFLFIMARKPEMDTKLYVEIVARCKAMGYPVDKLVSQQFHKAEVSGLQIAGSR